MTRVLAPIDNSAAALPVLETAVALAALYDAEVTALHVPENGFRTAQAAADRIGVPLETSEDDVVSTIAESAARDDVAAVVVGARATLAGRRPAGHVALDLIVRLAKPVVVVPPEAVAPAAVGRMLVPLDGTRTTTRALADVLHLAAGRDVEVVALHVRDTKTAPPFDDQPQHELGAWRDEFLRRYCPDVERVELAVRLGAPGEHVLRLAEEARADVVVLGWSRDLSSGHAQVVREALERSRVPVMLVAVDSANRTVAPRHPAAVG